MQPLLLLEGNPSRRRRSGGKKRRSAAQRAATRRMLAANRATRNPSRKRRSRRAAPSAAAPAVRRRSRRSVARVSRRRSRRSSFGGFSLGGAGRSVLGMVKAGAIGGGGAVLTDVAMGFLAQQFPTQTALTQRTDGAGNINPMYYGAKALVAYGIGRFGARLTRHAPAMAAGAFTVMSYEIIKTLIPAGTVPMGGVGYYNPARIVSGGVGAYANTRPALARILPLPAGGQSPGAVAARSMRMASVRR